MSWITVLINCTILFISSDGAAAMETNKEEEEESDDGKTAAFTVLLHGSLKVESITALTQLEWALCQDIKTYHILFKAIELLSIHAMDIQEFI